MSMYFCYLLNSRKTPTSKATYIGFSTQPIHRLRQHNGEIVAGARKTSKYRPWVHIAIVAGFPNKITALQFEWQWQHPSKTRLPGSIPVSKRSGYKRCLEDLVGLLNKGLWKQLNLNVLFPNEDLMNEFQRISGSDITATSLIASDSFESAATQAVPPPAVSASTMCTLCRQSLVSDLHFWTCNNCDTSFHVVCTAKNSLESGNIIPERGTCAHCNFSYPWIEVVRTVRSKANEELLRDSEHIDNNAASMDITTSAQEREEQGGRWAQNEVIDLMESESDEELCGSESETHSYCMIGSDDEAD